MEVIEYIEQSCATEDFLRRLFLRELNKGNKKEFLEAIDKLSISFRNHKFSVELARIYESETLMNEMRYEFNRLFIGPFRPKAVPYESAYFLNGGLLNEITDDVCRFYNDEGLQVSANKDGKMPDDYIGFEIQFLYFLSTNAINCWQEGDAGSALQILKKKQEFLINHPIKWFNEFAQAVKEKSEVEPWPIFDDFLNSYLENETKRLNIILANI